MRAFRHGTNVEQTPRTDSIWLRTSFPGGPIKLSLWIPQRDRWTWIALAEILALGTVLFAAPDLMVRAALGLPLLAHLGWSVLTSLPVGEIPGPPSGRSERRQNHHLRYRVVAFLKEVQRVEKFVQEAQAIGLPRDEVEKNLRSAEKRILATASEVVRVAGQSGV